MLSQVGVQLRDCTSKGEKQKSLVSAFKNIGDPSCKGYVAVCHSFSGPEHLERFKRYCLSSTVITSGCCRLCPPLPAWCTRGNILLDIAPKMYLKVLSIKRSCICQFVYRTSSYFKLPFFSMRYAHFSSAFWSCILKLIWKSRQKNYDFCAPCLVLYLFVKNSLRTIIFKHLLLFFTGKPGLLLVS